MQLQVDGPLEVKYWGYCDPCGVDAYGRRSYLLVCVAAQESQSSYGTEGLAD